MPLPTRILDLGDQEAPNIRLFVSDEGAVGRYAALSYCWGRSNHFLLTNYTLSDLQKGFHISQLPQTLQDAVRVTREIGLRYLWVDALCIIQGQDAEAITDWNVEVSKMATVYKNAFVTISAAAAQNASGGLFNGSHCYLPFVSRWASPGPREVAIWARATWWNKHPDLKWEPINSRAWTLQETIFSSRVLFYTSFGLLWKCKCQHIWAYSAGTRVFDNTGMTKKEVMDLSHPSHQLRRNSSGYSDLVARDGSLKAWMQMLELYTARNLTNPYDKLPALAAIAKQLSDSTGAEYLAGLWKPIFRQGLLWKHHPDYVPRVLGKPDSGNPMRSNGYRAPSWSWAAVDGVIVSDWTDVILTLVWETGCTRLAEVITYPIPALVNPLNPFGGIVKMSTELQMRGFVEKFHVHQYPRHNELVNIRPVEGLSDTGRLWVDDYTQTAAWRGRETEPLFCLHIFDFTENQGLVSHWKIKSSYALALLPVHGLDHTYIRVGVADIEPEPNSPSSDPDKMATETVTIL